MKKILLIDDHTDNLAVISFLLKEEGFEVLEREIAKDILVDIDTFQPDLILMDVMLNAENGMEICSRLKANSVTKELKIVLMTASATFQKVHQIFSRADHYLIKPFATEELMEVIRKILPK